MSKRLTRAATMEAYNFMLQHRDEFQGGTPSEGAVILSALLKQEVPHTLVSDLAGHAGIALAEAADRPKKSLSVKVRELEQTVENLARRLAYLESNYREDLHRDQESPAGA